MRYLLVIIFVLMLSGSALALPDWIRVNGSNTYLTTDCGNTYVFASGSGSAHLSDMFHNSSWYGGMPGQSHQIRGYTYYEAYYVDPDGQSRTSCVHIGANYKQLVFADNDVAVIECGCLGTTHVETWRYVIPRSQCGIYEMERKDLKRYYESQNNQQVQFLNTSILKTQFSGRDGSVTNGNWYLNLFSQFSKDNMPFEWMGGYDSANNISLAWIHTGSDNIGKTFTRRYTSGTGVTEQQVDFDGAGEGTRTEMPLGKTWIETWKGTVPGNNYAVQAKARSLVGHITDERKTNFISATRGGSYVIVNTGSMIYQQQPYLNYDSPYGSGNRMLTEYPYINGKSAYKGENLTTGEDYWNATYRNPDESSAWLEYTVSDTNSGLYKVRNERHAYLDADGMIWTYNITALTRGTMNFTIKYGLPSYSQSKVITNNTFSMKTVDSIEGEYGLTIIFPEHLNSTTSGLTTTLMLPERYMDVGDTASYTIYIIPHKWTTPVSPTTFHTREKTILKVPYRVLIDGVEWMPTDTVTAYSAQDTGNSYEIKAFSESGKQSLRIFSAKKILSMSADTGDISFTQSADGTILADWTVPSATVGRITLTYSDVASGPTVNFIANATEGYAPLTVEFTDASSINPTSWSWDVTNDGTNEYSGQKIYHTYSDAIGNSEKTYDVKLTVTNVSGSKSLVKSKYIRIYPLNVSFSTSCSSVSPPYAVQFIDLTNNGTANRWNWSFGDGTFAETQNPVHQYNSMGTYTIRLNASNEYSFGEYSITESFSSTNPPAASFISNATSGTSPLAIQFTDTSSLNPTEWIWDFGDAQASTERNPVHLYTSTVAKDYNVGLTVTNASGTSTITRSSYIHIDPAPAVLVPKANFTANMTSGISPLTVQFTDTSTNNPTSWYWMFGDGKSSTEQNPVHTFASSSSINYYVSLTAKNEKGSNKLLRNNYIHVDPRPVPVASFTANITSGTSPLTVQFTDTSTNNPTWWSWNFGDATFSNEQNPVHTYKSTYSRNYTITLNVTNEYGNAREKAIKSNYIHIDPA